MKIKISVPEVVNLIKELQENPSRIFEMATMNVQKDVGVPLTNLMRAELTHYLGRDEYERSRARQIIVMAAIPDSALKGLEK